MLKSPELVAQNITRLVAKRSFSFFKSRKFRKLSHLDEKDQVEQDRIFNEIVISGMVLGVLMFDTAAENRTDKGMKQYFNELSLELTNSYGNWLIELGSEKKHAELFKKLIKMRSEEYRKDYEENKKEVGSVKKTNVWLPIVSTGAFFHITRGDAKPDRDKYYFLNFRVFIGDLSIAILKKVL
jgi:hypothetical protein